MSFFRVSRAPYWTFYDSARKSALCRSFLSTTRNNIHPYHTKAQAAVGLWQPPLCHCASLATTLTPLRLWLYHMCSDRVSLFQIIRRSMLLRWFLLHNRTCVQNLQYETQIQSGRPHRNLRSSPLKFHTWQPKHQNVAEDLTRHFFWIEPLISPTTCSSETCRALVSTPPPPPTPSPPFATNLRDLSCTLHLSVYTC